MARRYTRREFLVDASFAFGSSLLLKVFAPNDAETSEMFKVSEVSSVEQIRSLKRDEV